MRGTAAVLGTGGAAAVGAAPVAAPSRLQRTKRRQGGMQDQDEEVPEEAAEVHEEVQEEVQEGRQEGENRTALPSAPSLSRAAVPEDLLPARLLTPSAPLEYPSLQHNRRIPDSTPSQRSVVLVRDRDRVYGDCLPKFPQPRKWRSPTRVRQAMCAPT